MQRVRVGPEYVQGFDMGKDGLLTLTEFAKIVGVNRTKVARAIQQGKLSVIKTEKVMMVDPKIATKEWIENRSHHGKVRGALTQRAFGKKVQADGVLRDEPERPIDEFPSIEEAPHDAPEDTKKITIAEAERREKVWKAKIAEIKYLEQAGQLIDAEKVKRDAFTLGRKVRDAILSIPSRIGHQLAAETDPHSVELMLSKELIKALERLVESDGESG